jgi:hypothetical protein
VSGYEIEVADTDSDGTDLKAISASCPDGKNALGGGARIAPTGAAVVADSFPVDEDTWETAASEILATNWALLTYVICATVED